MPGSPRKKRWEFPVKATGTQKARPTNRGKARRYTMVSARGGEALRRVNQDARGGLEGLRIHIARTRAEVQL